MRRLIYLFISSVFLIGCNGSVNKLNEKSTNISEMRSTNNIGVTGIGGIFFKCDNTDETKKWYTKNLNLVTNEYGSLFEFRLADNTEKSGYLQWSPFSNKTTYFEPSEKDFMINYRVGNLDELLEQFKVDGVTILDTIESYEYGKFLHILDPENNKIELWEPIDTIFTDLYIGKTTINTGIGGILFKSKNPEKLKEWYKNNLGFNTDEYGTLFSFQNPINPSETNYLQWSPMPDTTDYFSPSKQEYMINYRVDNLEALIDTLKKNGVDILDAIEYTNYGNFVHIMGPEGNKIELWDPSNTKEN